MIHVLGKTFWMFGIFMSNLSWAQPVNPCLQSIGINVVRHIPNEAEANCLIRTIDETVFKTLCPNGQISEKFAGYTRSKSLYLSLKPDSTLADKDAIYKDWKRIGHYEDLEINQALDHISSDAYNCAQVPGGWPTSSEIWTDDGK